MTKYNQVTPEIAAQLQAIVGAKRFFAGDAVKDDFSHDEMPIYGKYYLRGREHRGSVRNSARVLR